MSKQERFAKFAEEFAATALLLRSLKLGIRCTEASKPDRDTGDPGEPPCFMQHGLDDIGPCVEREMCAGCQKRVREKDAYRVARKRLSQCRAGMMRNAPALAALKAVGVQREEK